MKTMTPATERKLAAALDAVTDAVTAGDDPSTAVIKAARSHTLQPGHIDLLVHAYNTAATTRHRLEHDSPYEKAAEFPLADASKVRQGLYPEPTTKAASLSAIAPEYDRAPTWYKQAGSPMPVADPWADIPKCPPLPRDPAQPYNDACKLAKQVDNALVPIRNAAMSEALALEQSLHKLAEALRTVTSPSLADIRPNVDVLYGSDGQTILDHLADTQPALTKRASVDPYHAVNQAVEPYASLKVAVDHARHVAAYRVALSILNAEAERIKVAAFAPFRPAPKPVDLLDDPIFDTRGEDKTAAILPQKKNRPPQTPPQAPPQAPPPAPPQPPRQPAPQPARQPAPQPPSKPDKGDNQSPIKALWDALQGQASWGGGLIDQLGDKIHASHDAAMQRVLSQVASPAHEQRLREIRTQAVLHDLMANDPIVSGHGDPDEVAEVYNRLSQFAPRLTDQPLAMQAILRRSLQAPLEPFDVKMVGDMGSIPPGYVKAEDLGGPKPKSKDETPPIKR